MEHLWSYLRRFSRMTKEMRPSHRLDILSDALQYYSNKVFDGLCEYSLYVGLFMETKHLFTDKSLPLRISRALAWKKDAIQILGTIMSDFHGNYYLVHVESLHSCDVQSVKKT